MLCDFKKELSVLISCLYFPYHCRKLSEAIKSMANSSERMWKPRRAEWDLPETTVLGARIRFFNTQKLLAVGMCRRDTD